MNISTVGLIVWFGIYGLNFFKPAEMKFDVSWVLAVVAIIIAVALIFKK